MTQTERRSRSWEHRAGALLRSLRLESIRGKMLAFAAIATLVPALSTAWLSYVQNKRALTDKIAQGLESASTQGARETDLWLKERQYDLRVFASSYEVSENLEHLARATPAHSATRKARLTEYLNSVRDRFRDYTELVVFDRNGRLVARSGRGETARPMRTAWLKDLRAGQPVLGNAYLDSTTTRAAVRVAVPIYGANARFVGVFTATLNLGMVDTLLAQVSPAPSGRVYVITRDGILISGSELGSAVPLHTRLADGASRSLMAREAAVVEYTGFAGDRAAGVLQRIPRVAWAVVAEVPVLQAYRQVRRLRDVTLTVLATLVLGIGSLAYFLGLLIVRPLDRLRQGAAKVAAGDLSVDLEVVSGGEVGYLTAVFNEMVTRLRNSHTALERLSITDGLTGLYNRRHLNETLTDEVRRGRRHERPFAVMMADLDHFKQFNDTHGHQAGDRVLTRVAAVLREATREVDYAARYGGEEFFVLMPETDLPGALAMAERIREQLASETVAGEHVTLSVGVAEFPTHGDTPEAIIASADAALYAAKREGRNRVARPGRRHSRAIKS